MPDTAIIRRGWLHVGGLTHTIHTCLAKKKKGFLITLFTNGNLITPQIADYLQRVGSCARNSPRS